MASNDLKAILSPEVCAEIDHWLTKFPAEQRRSALLPALLFTQEKHQGWLSNQLIEAVADYLEIPHIAAYEVATFYSMYNLQPVGRHKINVCTNISCQLSGCEEIVSHLKKRLKINFNETTPDGKFTLKEVECLGACANAPMFNIGRQYYEDLTPQKVDDILDGLE